MAFKNSKKAPKTEKKPPIPRRVPIAKGETSTVMPTSADSPARSKLLKAAQGEIAERIERLEREERADATPAGTATTTAHSATDGPAATDEAPSADAAHGGTSPESAAPAKPAKKGEAPKTPNPAKEKKPKRVSALDAAATVLRDTGAPMRAVDLIDQMQKRGLWTSPGGRTPASTLYAAMTREIMQKGDASRFRKSDKGLFAAAPSPVRKGD